MFVLWNFVKFDAVCVFYQGPGLLVSDDDTALHGEFSDDWTVNGKVESISVYILSVSVCHLCSQTMFVYKGTFMSNGLYSTAV